MVICRQLRCIIWQAFIVDTFGMECCCLGVIGRVIFSQGMSLGFQHQARLSPQLHCGPKLQAGLNLVTVQTRMWQERMC